MEKTIKIKLPNNCNECKLFVAVDEAGYAGIVPRSCALMDAMLNVWGIALDRPEFCPLNSSEIDLKQ